MQKCLLFLLLSVFVTYVAGQTKIIDSSLSPIVTNPYRHTKTLTTKETKILDSLLSHSVGYPPGHTKTADSFISVLGTYARKPTNTFTVRENKTINSFRLTYPPQQSSEPQGFIYPPGQVKTADTLISALGIYDPRQNKAPDSFRVTYPPQRISALPTFIYAPGRFNSVDSFISDLSIYDRRQNKTVNSFRVTYPPNLILRRPDFNYTFPPLFDKTFDSLKIEDLRKEFERKLYIVNRLEETYKGNYKATYKGNYKATYKDNYKKRMFQAKLKEFAAYAVIGIIILYIVFLPLFIYIKYNWRKKILRKKSFDFQVQTELSQVNPHFLFNCMQGILKYVISNDKENASAYISKFSKLMRLILELSRQQRVSLEKDLYALELYMQLESLRFPNKFQYSIIIDDRISKENTLIPPIILQPFVENVILYGISNKEGGLIKITVIQEGEFWIRCGVEYNVVGFQKPDLLQGTPDQIRFGQSLGIKFTEKRLDAFSKKSILDVVKRKRKLYPDIILSNLKDEENRLTGVRVQLLLPFEPEF